MQRWVIILCLLALVGLTPAAEAFTISGTVNGGTGLQLRYVVCVPVRFDTFFVGIANLFTHHYSIANVDTGGYLLAAYQDLNLSFTPDPDEPRGFYGSGGVPSILMVAHDTAGIDIQLNPPNSGGFSGRLTYEGEHRGPSYVFAFYDATFGTMHGTGILFDTTGSGNGNFTAITDTFRTYYAFAFMDLNSNFRHDTNEPYGVYGGTTPAQIHVQATHFPDSVNIVLHDPQAAADPESAIPRSFAITSVYPNPFNSSTRIAFTLPSTQRIELSLYDVLGRKVRDITEGVYPAGKNEVTVEAHNLTTGVYFVRLMPPGGGVKKILLLK